MKTLIPFLCLSVALFTPKTHYSQIGTWTPLTNQCNITSGGLMILMTDGSVIAKSDNGTLDGIGNMWSKLTPDINGSYVNGTWSSFPSMTDTRLYFSARILRDGALYIAGGEYGTGKAKSEVYDPTFDTWYSPGPLHNGDTISDANSEILPDGRILQALVKSTAYGYKGTVIYNPKTYTYTYGPACIHSHDEASWTKLPDNSILFVDLASSTSERYIPASNHWIADANVPVNLYDPFGSETGAAFLLPNGKVFHFGATNKTAYYAPSGSVANGTWTAGPNIPNNLGATDAAAAMMVNGKILCAFSPTATTNNQDSIFKAPTYFYEFDYLTNTFTAIPAPDGNTSLDIACYTTNMLDLPDGTVLYNSQGDKQYYVYTPNGLPISEGKPTINTLTKLGCDSLMLTGTLFNGISEGAGYGDDWQMATNFPIVKLTSGSNVYYVKTFNWNSDGVQRGSAIDTVYCLIPYSLPLNTYSVQVVSNGFSSNPYTYNRCATSISELNTTQQKITIFPNPSSDNVTIEFNSNQAAEYTIRITDILGQLIKEIQGYSVLGKTTQTININNLAKGVYQILVTQKNGNGKTKLIVN